VREGEGSREGENQKREAGTGERGEENALYLRKKSVRIKIYTKTKRREGVDAGVL
jgi:hypothetical protein